MTPTKSTSALNLFREWSEIELRKIAATSLQALLLNCYHRRGRPVSLDTAETPARVRQNEMNIIKTSSRHSVALDYAAIKLGTRKKKIDDSSESPLSRSRCANLRDIQSTVRASGTHPLFLKWWRLVSRAIKNENSNDWWMLWPTFVCQFFLALSNYV